MLGGGLWLAIALVSLVLSGLLAAMQLSLREVSRAELEAYTRLRDGERRRDRVQRILADIDGHAVSLALPRMLFAMVFVVGVVRWVTALSGATVAGWLELLVGVPAAALVMWALGMVVPLSVARHAGAKTVFVWSGPIRVVFRLLSPIRRISAFFDEVVRRLSGEDREQRDKLEAEIRSLVQEHEREGRIDENAGEMLSAVMEFGTTTVEEIMTPRTEIEALAETDDLEAVKQFVIECGHSRIPVYREDLDHIIGILYAKDLLIWLARHAGNGPFRLEDLLRPALFVPETKTVSELMSELIANRVHLAVAADEYGGTAGIVTIEDMVEEIFGEIEDEYEQPDDERPSVDIDPESMSAEIDARKHIDDANDALEAIGVELPESADYDTVGGFVVVTLGQIPQPEQQLRHDRILVTVLEAEPTRVLRVRVERIRENEQAEAPEPAAAPGGEAEGG